MRDKYKKQVALLIRIMPSVYRIKEFAVHGGTAINLFHKNLPRYSVDIDLTYIPIQDRTTSLCTINERQLEVKRNVERTIPGIVVVPKPNVWKLLCTLGDATVKIEVNGTKRGIIGDTMDMSLCASAMSSSSRSCDIISISARLTTPLSDAVMTSVPWWLMMRPCISFTNSSGAVIPCEMALTTAL